MRSQLRETITMTPRLTGRRCQCGACGAIFSGESAFSIHRVGKLVDVQPAYGRRCLDADEMEAAGLKLVGEVWKSADSRDWTKVRGATA